MHNLLTLALISTVLFGNNDKKKNSCGNSICMAIARSVIFMKDYARPTLLISILF